MTKLKRMTTPEQIINALTYLRATGLYSDTVLLDAIASDGTEEKLRKLRPIPLWMREMGRPTVSDPMSDVEDETYVCEQEPNDVCSDCGEPTPPAPGLHFCEVSDDDETEHDDEHGYDYGWFDCDCGGCREYYDLIDRHTGLPYRQFLELRE